MSAERCEFTDACRCSSCLNELCALPEYAGPEERCPGCGADHGESCLCGDGDSVGVPDEFDDDETCDFTEGDVVT